MNAAQVSAKYLSLIEAAMRAGALATPDLGLFTGAPSLTVNTVLADLTEPTFTGYARQALTINPLRRNANGDYIDAFDSVTFQPSAAVAPAQTVTGIFVVATLTAVDYLLMAEYLDDAVVFQSALDALQVTMDAYFTNVRAYGGICGVC